MLATGLKAAPVPTDDATPAADRAALMNSGNDLLAAFTTSTTR